jgi:hypothetical protein
VGGGYDIAGVVQDGDRASMTMGPAGLRVNDGVAARRSSINRNIVVKFLLSSYV